MSDKRKLFWGGFVDNKLDSVVVDMGWGGYGQGDMVCVPAIFKTRKEARKKFQNVLASGSRRSSKRKTPSTMAGRTPINRNGAANGNHNKESADERRMGKKMLL